MRPTVRRWYPADTEAKPLEDGVKRIGRPPKPPEERRTARQVLYLTARERKALREVAKAAGMCPGRWVVAQIERDSDT